jgi:hypothetical protein
VLLCSLVRTHSCPLHTLNLLLKFVHTLSRPEARPVLELFFTPPWYKSPAQEFSAMKQWAKAAAELLFIGFGAESVCATGGVRDAIVSEPGYSSTKASITLPYANATAEECWKSWDDYWSVSQSIKNPKTSNVASVTLTSTVTISDFTMRPQSGSTATITTTLTSYALMPHNRTRVAEPSCKLLSIVPRCQSQWEEYIESELIPSPTPPSHCHVYQGRFSALTWESIPTCASSYNNALTSYRQQLSSKTSFRLCHRQSHRLHHPRAQTELNKRTPTTSSAPHWRACYPSLKATEAHSLVYFQRPTARRRPPSQSVASAALWITSWPHRASEI